MDKDLVVAVQLYILWYLWGD